LTIGRLELDRQTNTVRTLIGMEHGKIDFDVRRVGFTNDFRIASPTDVVAVKGTIGTCQTFGGPMDISGHRRNGTDAIARRRTTTDDTTTVSGDQKVRGRDSGPMETFRKMSNTTRAMGGMADATTRMERRGDESKHGDSMDEMSANQQTMRGEVAKRQASRRWLKNWLSDPRHRDRVDFDFDNGISPPE